MSELEGGIFVYGNYGVIGKYRAETIVEAANVKAPLIVALELFHAAYLLNTKIREKADAVLKKVVEPILQDEELRDMTVADDIISRVFAVKYLRELFANLKFKGLYNTLQHLMSLGEERQETRQQKEAKEPSRGDFNHEFKNAVMGAFHRAKEFAEKGKNIQQLYTKVVGKKPGLFQLLDIMKYNIAVDISLLLKKFMESGFDVGKKFHGHFGNPEGVVFGKDLSRALPSSLALPEEVFWYRYATGTLPLLELRGEEPRSFIMMIDKSGSMKGEKTLWARSIALKLLQISKNSNIQAWCGFFDAVVHRVYDLKRQSHEALKAVLAVSSKGGTSIDKALKEADRYNATIILITDGEDDVTYKPRNRLISVMVMGNNEHLMKISDEYLAVEPNEKGTLKLVEVLRR